VQSRVDAHHVHEIVANRAHRKARRDEQQREQNRSDWQPPAAEELRGAGDRLAHGISDDTPGRAAGSTSNGVFQRTQKKTGPPPSALNADPALYRHMLEGE